jgi:hypothetical protein
MIGYGPNENCSKVITLGTRGAGAFGQGAAAQFPLQARPDAVRSPSGFSSATLLFQPVRGKHREVSFMSKIQMARVFVTNSSSIVNVTVTLGK